MEQMQRPIDQTAKMRSAYNRTALGLGALYEVYQGIGSFFLIAAGVVAAIVLMLKAPELLSDELSIDAIMEQILELGMMRWILLLYAIGMVAGMSAGLPLMRVIRGRVEPIEKRSLPFLQFLCIVLIVFGVWGAGAAFGNLPAFFGVDESSILDTILTEYRADAWPLYLYVCIGAPVFEELACRKLLLDRLHPYGTGYAAIVSGLLFGLIHGNSAQFFLAFFVGVVFALVYLKTGRVLYTILLHAIINTTASLPELVAIAGIDIELGWNIAVGCLVVAGLVVLIVRHRAVFGLLTASDVPGSNRAVWRNPGMLIVRIAGLVMLVAVDLLQIVAALIVGNYGELLRLIPMATALVLILLLPRWTRGWEPPAPVPEPMPPTPPYGMPTPPYLPGESA